MQRSESMGSRRWVARRSAIASAMMLSVALCGCKEKKPPKMKVVSVKRVDEPKNPSAGAKAGLAGAVSRVAGDLRANRCRGNRPPGCKLFRRLSMAIKAPRQGMNNLVALAELINDQDKHVREVAGYLFSSRVLEYALLQRAKTKKGVDPKLANRLMEGLSKLRGYAASRAARATAVAAAVTDQLDALEKLWEKHPQQTVAGIAIQAMVQHGRLATFDRLQRYAKSKRVRWVRAAMRAPRGVVNWTAEERDNVCPWFQQYVDHADLLVASEATLSLVRCRDDKKYVTALLEAGEKRLADGKWRRPYDYAFRDLCYQPSKKVVAAKLCERNFKLLEKAALDAKVPLMTRAQAVQWLAYQAHDKKAVARLERLSKHKDTLVSKTAKEVLVRVKKRLAAVTKPAAAKPKKK
jgi:hypothetical protein